jgi:hypothetical protein
MGHGVLPSESAELSADCLSQESQDYKTEIQNVERIDGFRGYKGIRWVTEHAEAIISSDGSVS